MFFALGEKEGGNFIVERLDVIRDVVLGRQKGRCVLDLSWGGDRGIESGFLARVWVRGDRSGACSGSVSGGSIVK